MFNFYSLKSKLPAHWQRLQLLKRNARKPTQSNRLIYHRWSFIHSVNPSRSLAPALLYIPVEIIMPYNVPAFPLSLRRTFWNRRNLVLEVYRLIPYALIFVHCYIFYSCFVIYERYQKSFCRFQFRIRWDCFVAGAALWCFLVVDNRRTLIFHNRESCDIGFSL